MKAKSFFPSAIVISVLLSQLTFAALPRYEITDLGTLGGDYSGAFFISNNGGIVGYSGNSLLHDRAVLFDPTVKSSIIDLGTLGGDESGASSINTNIQIVGTASDSQNISRATLFDATGSGNNTDLGTLGGGSSGALSVNEIGLIVGYAKNASNHWRAVIFDPMGNGDNIDLGTLGGDNSSAYSINNSLQIVGRAETELGGYRKATLFDPTGKGNNMDLDPFHSGPSCATSINDNGQIVGIAVYEPVDDHPILFDSTGSGKNIDLGTLGGTWGQAWSINNRGQIVGKAGDNLGRCRATLFDPSGAGNNIDLNTLIKVNSGWILKEAWSINDAGWIVGHGINPDGEGHAYLMKPIPPKIIYVDDDATGADDGSSWADAYNDLQDALTVAWSGDEIRVAQGIYKPDQGDGITPGDREATFQLINGVTIKGGYAGAGAPDPNARDIDIYETILSGDLASNDIEDKHPNYLKDDPCRAENSYHVATARGTDETTVLDGVTVTAGNADGFWGDETSYGGGLFNENGSPIVTNCTFSRNSASCGGGMYNDYNTSPALTNCTFTKNSGSSGGGLFNSDRITLTDCIFIDNHANNGGGMYNWWYTEPTLINCVFRSNKAEGGGGIKNYYNCNLPTLINCVFIRNWAGYYGGGMDNENSSPTLINCTFTGNSSLRWGGGMSNCAGDEAGSNPKLINCNFIANSSVFSGGAMYNVSGNIYEGSDIDCNVVLANCCFSGNSAGSSGGGIYNSITKEVLYNCTFSGNSAIQAGAGMFNRSGSDATLTSCILWNDGNEIWNDDNSSIKITYSDIQGGWAGKGNIDVDPCFVMQGYWAMGDDDYFWIDGDYHLLPDSPCINTGDPNYIAGPNETDLDGRPRIINGRIDMGAYETPIFAEARILPRTINLASKGRWITCYIWLPDDYDVADIDSNSILIEDEIEVYNVEVNVERQVVIAKFNREDVQSILEVGDIKLTITCQLTDGTYFEATDIIKVVDKVGLK